MIFDISGLWIHQSEESIEAFCRAHAKSTQDILSKIDDLQKKNTDYFGGSFN